MKNDRGNRGYSKGHSAALSLCHFYEECGRKIICISGPEFVAMHDEQMLVERMDLYHDVWGQTMGSDGK